jgi:hypothetical protein
MAEVLSKIRSSRSGGDLLWKSEMRRRRSKTGDAVGRASWRSSFLGAPSAELFAGSSACQDSQYPGETKRKFKLRQVCPRKLSHCRGAPHATVPTFVPHLPEHLRGLIR